MAMDATFTAEEQYRRGRALLGEGREGDALECFRSAHQIDRANPRYRSFYGLGLALVERRFEKALALSGRNDIMVAWRPFQLNPDMPLEGMEREAYLAAKFGNGGRVQQIYGAIAETGKEEGIDFHFERIKRMPNTLASHRLVRLGAKQNQQDAVVENLFRAYFIEGRNVGEAEVLIDIAVESGIDLWASYERRLTDKINWRIQLNIRNAFASDDLIPISVQPDGQTWASVRVAPVQEWFVTNTFSF